MQKHSIHYFGNLHSQNIFIQPVDEHDFSLLENEINYLKDEDFCLVTFLINNWNKELTPWKGEPVFGKVGFGDGAKETLDFIEKELIADIEKTCNSPVKSYFLIGYSLAGLFALWCAYNSGVFKGIASVSPSVWYIGWKEYIESHKPLVNNIYLSLGDKEEKAKNPTMATVGLMIRYQYELLKNNNVETILEMNEGNHFINSDIRTAKGMKWLLDLTKTSC